MSPDDVWTLLLSVYHRLPLRYRALVWAGLGLWFGLILAVLVR